MTTTEKLTVGVFNIERLGHDKGRGNHRLPAALDWLLEQTPVPPDILAFPEATNGLADGQRAIRRGLVGTLAPRLGGAAWYEPLFSHQSPEGRKNSLHLVLVNTAKVRPLGWFDPEAHDAGKRHYGFAECSIFGHEVGICCEHWSGGEGRAALDQAANRVAQKGNMRKTLLLGDFNASGSWEEELHIVEKLNWYKQCKAQDNLDKLEQKGWFNPDGVDPGTGEPGWYWPDTQTGPRGWWEIDTRQIDKLRSFYKFLDMGEEAGDPTVTTDPRVGSGLRIDLIFRSLGFPARVSKYAVRQPPRHISDHAYVFGEYDVEVADPSVHYVPADLD